MVRQSLYTNDLKTPISMRLPMELFNSLYGIKGAVLKGAVNQSLEYAILLERKQDFVKNFPGGMKKRLNIAHAMGHNQERSRGKVRRTLH